jgi:thioredoxin-related protein
MSTKHILSSVLVLGVAALMLAMKPAAPEGIRWMSIEEALSAQKKQPKKIFIDVYTDWCGWCKKMDATSFAHPVIVQYMNEHFYAVKLNAEQRETIRYQGKDYNYVARGNRGYHEFASFLLNEQMSYPTTVYLNEKGEKIFPVPGYLDAKNMEVVLNYVGTDGYQKGPWETYQTSFSGKVK